MRRALLALDCQSRIAAARAQHIEQLALVAAVIETDHRTVATATAINLLRFFCRRPRGPLFYVNAHVAQRVGAGRIGALTDIDQSRFLEHGNTLRGRQAGIGPQRL